MGFHQSAQMQLCMCNNRMSFLRVKKNSEEFRLFRYSHVRLPHSLLHLASRKELAVSVTTPFNDVCCRTQSQSCNVHGPTMKCANRPPHQKGVNYGKILYSSTIRVSHLSDKIHVQQAAVASTPCDEIEVLELGARPRA